MIKTIQQLTHYIRTAFGDSDKTFGNDPDDPLQGLLQGNGASGMGWLAVATVIVNLMRSAGFGFQTWSSIQLEAIQLVCFAFVDDTDLIHSSTDNTTPGEGYLFPNAICPQPLGGRTTCHWRRLSPGKKLLVLN